MGRLTTLAVAPAAASSAVSAFTNFPALADAARMSAAGQILLRHVQRRIIAALEAAGFNTAAWSARSVAGSPDSVTAWEVLRVTDPLSGEILDVDLAFGLQQEPGRTQLRMTTRVRSDTANHPLTGGELIYQTWDTANLLESELRLHEAFHTLVAPDGLDDVIFSGLADDLTLALAP